MAEVYREIDDGTAPWGSVLLVGDGDDIVGIAACSAAEEPDTFDVVALYVASDWQRRGVGRRLLEVVTARYTELGAREMHIAVLAANEPARRFYERLGGRIVGHREVDEAGEMLPGFVFGWELGS